MSRPGGEYPTSNQYIAYPFWEDAIALAHGDTVPAHNGPGVQAVLPLDFLLDAVIYTDVELQLPCYLREITRTGDVYLLYIIDSADTEVITVSYTATTEQVITFATATTTIRLLKGPSFDAWLASLVTTDYFGICLPFESSVCERKSLSVQCLRLNTGTLGDPIIGDIQFIAGYNTNIATDATTNAITITSSAGAGMGRVPCEEQEPVVPVVAPMQLVPDALGNVKMTGDSCVSIIPMPGLDAVQVQGNCYACCTCDDYVAMGNALKLLIARANAVKQQYFAMGANYNNVLVPDYTDQYFPALRKMYGSVTAIRGSDSGSQANAYLAISIQNKAEADATDVTVTTVVTPTIRIIKGSYAIGNTTGVCNLVQTFATVPQGASLALNYHVTTDNAATPPLTVTCIMTYTIAGRPYTETIYTGNFE